MAYPAPKKIVTKSRIAANTLRPIEADFTCSDFACSVMSILSRSGLMSRLRCSDPKCRRPRDHVFRQNVQPVVADRPRLSGRQFHPEIGRCVARWRGHLGFDDEEVAAATEVMPLATELDWCLLPGNPKPDI